MYIIIGHLTQNDHIDHVSAKVAEDIDLNFATGQNWYQKMDNKHSS